MAIQDAIINRYINDVATLRHQLIVAEIERDEAREESSQKDGAISSLAQQIQELREQQLQPDASAEVVAGEVVEDAPVKKGRGE